MSFLPQSAEPGYIYLNPAKMAWNLLQCAKTAMKDTMLGSTIHNFMYISNCSNSICLSIDIVATKNYEISHISFTSALLWKKKMRDGIELQYKYWVNI